MNTSSDVQQTTSWHAWRHELVLLGLLLLLHASAGQLIPKFNDLQSQLFLSKQLWETAILALPMTLVIITGGIDLSIGSAMGLSAVAFGTCFASTQNVWVSSVACVAIGTLGGYANGRLIAQLTVHPLIITLATYAAYRGIAEGWSQGLSYSQFGSAFGQLARGKFVGVPIPGYLFLLLSIAVTCFLAGTPTGRYLYAIGHNRQASRFSGIAVERITTRLYTFSGLMAGVATLIYVSRFDTAKADVGMGYELDVITAVVIGGTSIFGGRGNVLGTALGLLLIHETKLFVGRYWQIEELKSIFVGLLLIGSVLTHRLVTSRSG